MKKRNTYTIGLGAIALVALVLLVARKKKKIKIFERLERIADEGYETAGDILYPIKQSGIRLLSSQLLDSKKKKYSF